MGQSCCGREHSDPYEEFKTRIMEMRITDSQKEGMLAEMRKRGHNPRNDEEFKNILKAEMDIIAKQYEEYKKQRQANREKAEVTTKDGGVTLQEEVTLGVQTRTVEQQYTKVDENQHADITEVAVKQVPDGSIQQLLIESVDNRGQLLDDAQLIAKFEELKGDIVSDVDLSNNLITEVGVEAVLTKFTQLSSLSLSQNQITKLSGIQEKLKNSLVSDLALGGNPLNGEEVINFLSELKYSKLKKIGLGGLELDDQGSIGVMHALKGSNVIALDLSFNSISSNGLQGMCNQGFSGEVLIVAGNDFSNPGLAAFVENLDKFPNLQTLDIRGNYFMGTSDLQESFESLKEKDVTIVIDGGCGLSSKLVDTLKGLGVKIQVGSNLNKEEQLRFPIN